MVGQQKHMAAEAYVDDLVRIVMQVGTMVKHSLLWPLMTTAIQR